LRERISPPWLELSYFYGLGALVVFLGAFALGRVSVRSVRDVEYARRPVAVEREPAEIVTDDEASRSAGWRNRAGLFGRRPTGTAH